MRFALGQVKFGPLSWTDVAGVFTLAREGVYLDLSSANLCGIDTPAQLQLLPAEVNGQFTLATSRHDLSSSVSCLFGERALLTGTVDLER